MQHSTLEKRHQGSSRRVFVFWSSHSHRKNCGVGEKRRFFPGDAGDRAAVSPEWSMTLDLMVPWFLWIYFTCPSVKKLRGMFRKGRAILRMSRHDFGSQSAGHKTGFFILFCFVSAGSARWCRWRQWPVVSYDFASTSCWTLAEAMEESSEAVCLVKGFSVVSPVVIKQKPSLFSS